MIDIFENSINDFDAFFNRLEILYNTKLYRRESIIVFDEVQLYPKARQFIKHLVADGRYDFAEFREYMLVGGMPKAVLTYSNDKDFEKVEFEKKQICNLYVEDINKFANGEKTKAKMIFEYIPTQLQKKQRKLFMQT